MPATKTAAARPIRCGLSLTIPRAGDDANDFMMDMLSVLPASRHRDENMRRSHLAGKEACEVCGRALESGAWSLRDENGDEVAVVGPDCARNVAAALRACE